MLAKALYDNIADNEDELTFRKGDIITVLEKDIDGLYGWWLCSLHGRQGIAPGNRLTEIPKEPEPMKTPPSYEELDYAVPRPFEENGEDYDVPRSVYSPQDYDIPRADPKFEYPEDERPESLSKGDNIYQEIYDVPAPTPEKKKPEPLLIPGKKIPPKRPPSPQRGPQSPQMELFRGSHLHQVGPTSLSKSPPKAKPPRKSILEKESGLKPKQTPPPRPPKPTSPRSPRPEMDFLPQLSQEVYDVPVASKTPISHTKSAPNFQSDSLLYSPQITKKAGSSTSLNADTTLRNRTASNDSSVTTPREEIYDVPTADVSSPDDIYDVPPSVYTVQEALQDQGGDIYDVPRQHQPVWEKNRFSDESSRSSSGVSSELGGVSRASGESDRSNSRPGSDSSDKGMSTLGVGSSEVSMSKRRSGGSGGKRSSAGSTGSGGKVSSEDDDYVDYQEIYGYGRTKPVNLYDVPTQPASVQEGNSSSPTKKQTKVSILQRINMSAVKGIKVGPPAALQRLTKLEQAVDVTVTKLLSFVTNTWRDPTLLRANVADIRDIAGKAKTVLRLLTEFGLSTLVNSRNLGQQELTGMLSRAIEPLLETYYSLKLTLQRLDDTDWKAPLSERKDKEHDDLDMIMAYMQGVPQDSKKLATVIRTAATSLYRLPKEPLEPPREQKEEQPTRPKESLPQEITSHRLTKENLTTTFKQKEEQITSSEEPPPPIDRSTKTDKHPMEEKNSTKVSSKIERFKPVSMEAECSDVNSATMLVGLIKASVDANIKPGDGPKFSPETVRRLCQLSSNSSSSLKDEGETPMLPPRISESVTKDSYVPKPPTRQDSGERVHHVRQKSLERFAPDGEATPKGKVPPTPPPKPKLDRKPTIRKSYKHRGKEDDEAATQRPVKFRERLPVSDSPKEKRKCNSDPTDIERIAEDGNNNRRDKRVSDGLGTTMPGETIVSRSIGFSPSHSSDSALPSSPTGQRTVTPLSPRLKEFQGNPKPDIRIRRSKSFTRTKPPTPKPPFGENGMSNFILSFDDKELLEFYKYEIDAQLFVLNEAMKSLFAAIDENKPPKVFVSNSKFVVLSAHKFIYIGETIQSKISHDKLGNDITAVTSKLSECAKRLVQCTKLAALQYSAVSPMREMASAASAVSEAAIELHKVVKLKTNS